MRRTEPLSMRQARVGIIANPAKVAMPVHLPRDVWTRWPDLRSRRRHHGARAKDPAQGFGDPVLDGVLLGSYARDLRAGVCDGQDRAGLFARVWPLRGKGPALLAVGTIATMAVMGYILLQ
ncbi:hypothetical protein [Roseinatronobacter sp. NSM]|uniref:hypothetical protein n=1 Tax=Roseinatronobacter sp. NSM TaxID=3457785 RepID=UPI0040367DDC